MEEKPNSDGHPIPSELVESIDVIATKKDGSVLLTIVSSGYLDDSDYTTQRIVEKLNNYLGFINDDEYKNEFGSPSPEKTLIVLTCSQKPAASVIEFIASIQENVNHYNASLFIDYEQEKQE